MSYRTSSFQSLVAAGTAALVTSLLAPSAMACGGFFCNSSAPVFQAAERIIFAQDGEKVTQIVEVLYEGPSEKFSWVLPVPGVPKPGVSSTQAFDRLDGATSPQYYLERTDSCYYEDGALSAAEGDGDGDSAGNTPKVTVLDAGSVGPFDYETISVSAGDDPEKIAVDWLTKNGYDVTPETGELLAPYLENGLNLIAFRLQKGQSTGAIRPIALEYNASKMSIPIRPTSVAANDDMPVLVWVLGDHRAVPTNYRGLELNELLIDWFNPAPTYNAVVTAAANEAGGQGFVTELSLDADNFIDAVRPQPSDVDGIFNQNSEDMRYALNWIVSRLGTWDGFLESAAAHIQLRDGVTIEEFVSCPDCYLFPEYYQGEDLNGLGFGGALPTNDEGELDPLLPNDPIFDTDLAALEQSLRETVIQPLIDVGNLLEKHAKITRLYTTMSADEMTKDPTFEFNPDVGDISNVHTAKLEQKRRDSCSLGSWTVTLPDGTKVYGEGENWPHSLADTNLAANARIVQFSTKGQPAVISDLRGDNMTEHKSTPAGTPSGAKGGCSMTPAAPGSFSWLAALGLAFVLGRRRTRRSREGATGNPTDR